MIDHSSSERELFHQASRLSPSHMAGVEVFWIEARSLNLAYGIIQWRVE